MATNDLKIDSGILQYAPKGAFYEDADQQFKRVFEMWSDLFNYDRSLFCLTTLLGGTRFSKGAMSHMLLGNPVMPTTLPAIPELPMDYESKVILYNLRKETLPRAMKNLLMLTGAEGFNRVNNARSRKLILEFLFSRDNRELDGLAVNYKGKMKTLVRHALGKQDVFKILHGDSDLFMKWVGRYNQQAAPVFMHIFDKEPVRGGLAAYFPKIDQYWALRRAAQKHDMPNFVKYMRGMPQRTVIGFRNTYKVPIELSEIYEKTKMSDRDKIQMESAAKRSGTKTFKVNYMKQELYDLWKAFYFKLMNGEFDNLDDIETAIVHKSESASRVDIGDCVIVIDSSRSMFGSDQRPLHPFLTSLCLVASLQNVKDVFYVGGKIAKAPTKSETNILIPMNATPLWKGLVDAVASGVENIVIISDGYENEVKGMFEHTYNHFKNEGHKFNVLHLNPVFAADAKSGTVRKLASDIVPMPLADHKYFETELIFNRMIENRNIVKKLLVQKYKQLIG
jgi:hypothetical protein